MDDTNKNNEINSKEISEDFYFTIKKQKREEIKVKKSRFIATAIPVKSKEEALEKLDEIKVEFHDSRHNCFAYRIGNDGLEYRYSDDGEPNNSAGKPILFSIKKYNYSDILVVVTRFFGGTKLGKGPLARAYGESAELALELCEAEKVDITKQVIVFCTYEDINVIKRLTSQYAIKFEEDYKDSIQIKAEIPVTKVEEFCDQITQLTSARAGFRVM